jgi:hypothetical protein
MKPHYIQDLIEDGRNGMRCPFLIICEFMESTELILCSNNSMTDIALIAQLNKI